jgi:hypothetical protein
VSGPGPAPFGRDPEAWHDEARDAARDEAAATALAESVAVNLEATDAQVPLQARLEQSADGAYVRLEVGRCARDLEPIEAMEVAAGLLAAASMALEDRPF